MDRTLEAIRSSDVQFATTPDRQWHRGSFARRIVVTAPPELVRLATSGDLDILDALVGLLDDPARAWAAEVALAAMTRHDEVVVAAYDKTPHEWLATLGPTAPAQWKEWLATHRDRLTWNAEQRVFVER